MILAVIPARGGSKGIPGKNIKDLYGQPLISYTIQAALDCKKIDRVVVSTDSEEIVGSEKVWGGCSIFTSGSTGNGHLEND